MGCRLSDHGLNHCYADFCSEKTAAQFSKARRGKGQPAPGGASAVRLVHDAVLRPAGRRKRLDQAAASGRLPQAIHAACRKLGPDTGFDSIGDWPQAEALAAYLDRLDQENALPKTILYNLNPADNYVFATMIGNFQDGTIAGKMQFGSGWWFLDQKEAMEWQINALSNLGLLSRFVGMLTDSRSFMSYPRHEYFRRVLCNMIGRDVENGELPDSDELVGGMIRNICYKNVKASHLPM